MRVYICILEPFAANRGAAEIATRKAEGLGRVCMKSWRIGQGSYENLKDWAGLVWKSEGLGRVRIKSWRIGQGLYEKLKDRAGFVWKSEGSGRVCMKSWRIGQGLYEKLKDWVGLVWKKVDYAQDQFYSTKVAADSVSSVSYKTEWIVLGTFVELEKVKEARKWSGTTPSATPM